MAIDYWALSKDYSVGDTVQRCVSDGDLSPFYGRVTAVHPGIGFVDVQWAFGNERISADELVRVNPEHCGYTPPSLNFSHYPGWDTRSASQQTWNGALPPSFHRDLAQVWNMGAKEVSAYDTLWRKYSNDLSDADIKSETALFYRVASNLGRLRIESLTAKQGTYWAAQGRQHRATGMEITTGKPTCPKCKKAAMRKTTYKIDADGKRVGLFACPKCLYLIRQVDIHGPDGEPISW